MIPLLNVRNFQLSPCNQNTSTSIPANRQYNLGMFVQQEALMSFHSADAREGHRKPLVTFRTLCIFALITLTCAAVLAARPVFAWASD